MLYWEPRASSAPVTLLQSRETAVTIQSQEIDCKLLVYVGTCLHFTTSLIV